MAGFDVTRLPRWEIVLRLVLAVAIILRIPAIHGAAVARGLLWIGLQMMRSRAGLGTQGKETP
ncbi:hypothetical protein [Ruegeria marina]|uniref:hypothetical protein n=1 Tax=Ruegeria marina TaxID=639004 RepID=UPI00115FD5EF|nr:hypothetical protein [Ruegeria marina]